MNQILNEAIQDGLIAYPVPEAIENYIFKRQSGSGLEIKQLEGLAVSSATTERQEQTYGLMLPPTTPGYWGLNQFIEVARVRSMPQHITILRCIDTTITDQQGSASQPPLSNPFHNYGQIGWWLTIGPMVGADPEQRISPAGGYGGFSLKPQGVGFAHLDPWDDARYLWGGFDNKVTMPIPAGYNLSLWAQILRVTPAPYPLWGQPIQYVIGNIVSYLGLIYICIQNHTSNPAFTPDVSPTLWEIFEDPAEGFFGGVAGRLITSYQSEDHLSSNWQAERTFKE